MKEYLAPFFGNNFFQNLLSPYTVEENLLYVISLLLKNEIDKLSSENDLDKFLNNSRCGYLLNELRKKREVIILVFFFQNKFINIYIYFYEIII